MEGLIQTGFLALLFLFASSVYSMAGLGGASTYLALLVIFGTFNSSIVIVALLCNIIVTGGCLFQFIRSKLIPVRIIVPFIFASVPMAFLGGYLPVKEPTIKVMLAVCLFIAGIYLINIKLFANIEKVTIPSLKNLWIKGLVIGGVIGFISGMVGIGGGIFLAPILYMLKWTEAKKIAAASSLFILVNSIAGLCGQMFKTSIYTPLELGLPLFIAVFLGSQIGSILTIFHLRPVIIRRITALLVLVASLRILWTTIF